MTNEEQEIFQKGFMMAVNFLYHRQDDANKESFKAYLDEKMDGDVVAEAIALRNSKLDANGNGCPPGECPDGHGNCSPCAFRFAFDGKYIA